MKKLLCLLLTFSLLLCGCAAEPAGIGRTAPQDVIDPATLDGGTAYSPLTLFKSNTLALWGDTVFYECDPNENSPWQPKLYSSTLGKEDTPQLVFNGEMIGLYGDVLVVCDDEAYYARNLSGGKKWVQLGESGVHEAAAEGDDVLYLFGYTENGCYADAVELSTLHFTRAAMEYSVTSAQVLDGTLYYVRTDGDRFALCRAVLTEKQEQFISHTESFDLHQAGGKLVCCSERCSPLFYDPATNETALLAELSSSLAESAEVRGGVLRLSRPNQEPQYFDIAAGVWIDEPGFAFESYWEFEGGYATAADRIYRLTVGDRQYTADLTNHGKPQAFAANDQGTAFLISDSICTVSWKTGEIYQIAHYEAAD